MPVQSRPLTDLEAAIRWAHMRRDWLDAMALNDPVVVRTFRQAGLSWDRIAAAMGGVPTAQTLRRLYGSTKGA